MWIKSQAFSTMVVVNRVNFFIYEKEQTTSSFSVFHSFLLRKKDLKFVSSSNFEIAISALVLIYFWGLLLAEKTCVFNRKCHTLSKSCYASAIRNTCKTTRQEFSGNYTLIWVICSRHVFAESAARFWSCKLQDMYVSFRQLNSIKITCEIYNG